MVQKDEQGRECAVGVGRVIVPEGKKKPADLDKDIVVLKQPLDHIYLAATSAMALFDSMDGLDSIRMSGAQASDWYIDNAKKAMEQLPKLKGCQVHTTVMLSEVDTKTFARLGVNLTSEPIRGSKKFY